MTSFTLNLAHCTRHSPRPRHPLRIMAPSDIVRFSGHKHLRQRITLAVLSGRSVRIDSIRSEDVHVGLRDYEISFLRLVEKITNGTTIEISVTGESSRLPDGRENGDSVRKDEALTRRYLIVVAPGVITWRELYAHLSSWTPDWILLGGIDSSRAVLQEAAGYRAAWDNGTGGAGYDGASDRALRPS